MQNATKVLLISTVAGVAAAIPVSANAMCWADASQSYGIPAEVLKAVAKTESGFNPKARNKNLNGTYDIGIMQINSGWLQKLEKYGIDEQSLNDACTNIKVGAWILANNAIRLGWNWNAIGAYNVGCSKLDVKECDRRRNKYAWKIHAAMNQVGDLRGNAIATKVGYENGATAVSNTAIHRASIQAEPKKILVIQMGGTMLDAPMRLAKLDGSSDQPRGLDVASFMEYEGEGDDE